MSRGEVTTRMGLLSLGRSTAAEKILLVRYLTEVKIMNLRGSVIF